MTAFNYTALDKKGKKIKGVAEADSARQVREQLRAKSLIPINIETVSDNGTNKQETNKKNFNFKKLRRKRISTKDLTLITRQMATLLEAGIPIDEMLTAVSEQTEKQHVKSLLLGVRARVLEGYSLASSLDTFPNSFSKLYRTTVASGEKSGKLDFILEKLADYTERQYKLKQKIMQALLYPILMTVVSIVIVIFLLIYVVPKIVNTFNQTHMVLPLSTRVLIGFSTFLEHYGWWVVLALALIVIFFYRMLKVETFRSGFDKFMLKVPLLGSTMRTINEARFGRTFGILAAASVPVLEAMRASALLITPLPMRHAVELAIDKVREGSNIHYALKQTKFFAPMFIHLVASGENSGRLESMLQRAALTQEEDVGIVIDNLLTLFEPVLILIMGAIVLFIVLAIMLPIFAMDQVPGT